jgi:hypothetical protein
MGQEKGGLVNNQEKIPVPNWNRRVDIDIATGMLRQSNGGSTKDKKPDLCPACGAQMMTVPLESNCTFPAGQIGGLRVVTKQICSSRKTTGCP